MQATAKFTKTHNAILDAAVRCYASIGIDKTAMVDIATEAGIGRTTLYRHFKSQDDVLVQAVIRDIYEIFDRLTACLDAQETIEDKLVEGMLFCLKEFSRRPVVSLMLDPSHVSRLIDMGINAEDMNVTGAELTQPVYDAAMASGRLRPDMELNEFVAWVTRVLISFQTAPNDQDDSFDRLRPMLHKFFVPSLLLDTKSP